MNYFEKIQYSMNLSDRKEKLQEEIFSLEEQIVKNTNECEKLTEHIGVIMGHQKPSSPYSQSRCLLCGTVLSSPTSSKVHARDYLKDVYDDRIDSEREEKFNVIQRKALEITRENPQISKEELTSKLNHFIDESLATKTNKVNHEQAYEYSKKQNHKIL